MSVARTIRNRLPNVRRVVKGVKSGSARLGTSGTVGAVIVALFVVVGLLGPLFVGDPNEVVVAERLSPPSSTHWLGTDQIGRDLVSRSVAATRVALLVSFATGLAGLTVGGLVGVVAGYARGRTDLVITAVADVMFAFPALLLAIVVVAALGPGLGNALVALTVVYVPRFIRVARASTLQIRRHPYVEAALLSKISSARILIRHIIPNVAGPLLVMLALTMASAQLAYASLSFLGLGLPVPQADFGSMLARGKTQMLTSPWLVLGPAALLTLLTISLNLLADGLRDIFDPKQDLVDV